MVEQRVRKAAYMRRYRHTANLTRIAVDGVFHARIRKAAAHYHISVAALVRLACAKWLSDEGFK